MEHVYTVDGTWQSDRVGRDDDTVIVQLAEAIGGKLTYSPGVGTRFGFLGRWIGGAFGAGGGHRIKLALRAWQAHGCPDNVVVAGYSRGAYIVVKLCHKLKKKGVTIKWLGLVDAVGSFGVPGNRWNIGWPDTIPSNVERCFHAMFIHERRRGFPVCRFNAGAVNPSIRETWFFGNHSDANQENAHGDRGQQVLRGLMMDAQRHGVHLLRKPPEHVDLSDTSAPWQGKGTKRRVLPGDCWHPSAVHPHHSVPSRLRHRRSTD